MGVKRVTEVETHNYRRSRERGISVAPQAGTYRVTESEEGVPD